MQTDPKFSVSVRARMPMVCPPEQQETAIPMTAVGMACRVLILFCAVFGLAWFVCDAFLLTASHGGSLEIGILALLAAAAVVYFTAVSCCKVCRLIGLPLLAIGVLAAALCRAPAFWRNTFTIAVNACLQRLLNRGYGGPNAHLLNVPQNAAERGLSLAYADCILLAAGVLAFVLAAVFVPCLIRRTRLVLPAVLGGAILAAVFTCNINSSNWSFAFVLSSFSAILVLAAYDRRYLRRRKECDNAATLFAEDLGRGKEQVQARIAAGGFAGLGMLLIAMLILLLPAAYTKNTFVTIDLIDAPMQQARRYVTAYLRGDNPVLDEYGYGGDVSAFSSHSTDIKPRAFTGEKIFEVETLYNTNLYLRGWTATGYRDGCWYSADVQSDADTFRAYRDTFGTAFMPESLRAAFYRYVDADAVYETDYTQSYQNHANRGFITMQVNLRRVGGNANMVYVPSCFNADVGILNYASGEPSALTYINYFDGIYTGRRFLPGAEYAAVAYATTMRDRDFMDTVSVEIAAYNLANRAMYSWLEIDRQEQMAIGERVIGMFVHSGNQSVFYTVTRTESGFKGELDSYGVTVRSESGETLRARTEALELANEIFSRYLNMTESELAELQDAWQVEESYAEHVYNTYCDDTDSDIVLCAAQSAVDTDLWAAAETDRSDIGSIHPADYTNRHAAVMAVMEYLSAETDSGERDEKGKPIMLPNFTYTLEPTQTPDENYDGVDNFLAITKEGYCVQFASAAVLMLRELGIPARYVEGYIVTDFTRNTNSDSLQRYSAAVRDYHAHAWIEVYYDGIGWLNYEATPAYASELYEPYGTVSAPVRPWEDPVEEEEENVLDLEELAQLAAEAEAAEARYRSMRIACAVIIVLLLITVFVMLIAVAVRRARRSAETRRWFCDAARAGLESGSERAHLTARYLIDTVMALFAACGFAPETGELRDAYAARLEEPFGALCSIPLRELLEEIAAEEFGSGISREALQALSVFCEALEEAARRTLPIHRRFYYRYIKHLL